MDREQLIRERRRREALDSLAQERDREQAIIGRLETALRDLGAWQADEAAFAHMEPEDVETLRQTGFAKKEPEGDSRTRLEARVAEIEAELEECLRRQRAFEHYAEAQAGAVRRSVPVLTARHVRAALDESESVEVVRKAFLELAAGRWEMPSKVYVTGQDGDFRAMSASGSAYAVLKWVTSFPANPEKGLPTVTGLVLLSDATTGLLVALADAAAVTELRTGAAAVLAAETLARPTAAPAAVIGCGVNGRAVARTFLARGRQVVLWDVDREAAERVAEELGEGADVAVDQNAALGADIVATVTPGHELVFEQGVLTSGQHVSLMGADGPGKAEIAVEELLRSWVVCDEWEQASHHGDLARAVASGQLSRGDVAELGRVLAGHEVGRSAERQITLFDSTGLAVQDLAVATAVYERYISDPRAEPFTDIVELEVG